MKAYLLTWNPKYFPWEKIGNEREGGLEWICLSKQPRAGDLFFISAVGDAAKKGVFCSGIVDTLKEDVPYPESQSGKSNYLVMKEITFLGNPEKGEVLELDILQDKFPEQRWNPQAAGIEIKQEYLAEFLQLWEQFVQGTLPPGDKSFATVQYFQEGNRQKKLLSYYERDPAARAKAIAIHGYTCMVCGKKMEDIYGAWGKDFIHVHHIQFLSNYKDEHTIDPAVDMATVCPNCHAMLHRKDQNGHYANIDELKGIIGG
jgi:5-methylcytosine-specific restriction protein A